MLMLKFLLLAIIIEAGIIFLIVKQTQSITQDIYNDSQAFITTRVNEEMMNITRQITDVFKTGLFNFGLILSQVQEALVLQQSSNYQQFFPTVCTTPITPAQFSNLPGPSTDFSTSSLFPATPLIAACPTYDTLSLSNILPHLITDFLKQSIKRVTIHYIDTATPTQSYIRMFPQELINTFTVTLSSLYTKYQSLSDLSNYNGQDRVLIYSPSTDEKTLCTTCNFLSLSKFSTLSANTKLMVELELYSTFISDIFESHHYRSSVEFVVLLNQGSLKKIVYAPSYWNIEAGGSNSARDFFYSTVQSYSGIKLSAYTSLISTWNQMTVTRLNAKGESVEYITNAITMNQYFDQDMSLAYLDATVGSSVTDFYVIIFYGEASQMYSVIDTVYTLTQRQDTATILICIISGLITIMIVLIVTYRVAVKIARPLRGLIKMSKRLNNNTMHKKSVMNKTKEETIELLNQSEYQVKELISSFKELINNIEKRNNKNKSSEKARSIDYPLNQYEKSFVEKAKGRSDINWKGLVSFIENEPKFQQKSQKKQQ